MNGQAAATARALRLALALREPASGEKAERVTKLGAAVASRLGLSAEDAALVELGASVQDVGRLAVPDELLAKRGPFEADEWQQLRGHAVAAGALLKSLPELRPLAPIVRATHERWDGDGYPDGAAGEQIPLASRVISACDAYVAMTSDRPFRRALDQVTALHQLAEVAGHQLDPRVAKALAAEVPGRTAPRGAAHIRSVQEARTEVNGNGLVARLDAVGPVPALPIAQDRVLETLAEPQPSTNDTVSQIELDPGLTIQVLCAANVGRGRQAVTTVADAVACLDSDELRRLVTEAPVLDYLWPESPREAVLERFRLHAVAVQRATLRLAEAAGYNAIDELAVPALLHDIGRVALTQIDRDYDERLQAARSSEERLRVERRLYGMDHAAVGGILARRWGLPDRVAQMISEHHHDQAGAEALLLYVGDAIAHQTQGGTGLSPKTVRSSYALGLTAGELHSITFELPHQDGSRRLRAEPCPLSKRELETVAALATSKVYGEIAGDLGVSASTVRTHLHNAYRKLGVVDRAQAVLMATERGWL